MTHAHAAKRLPTPNTRRKPIARRGNLLVGCGVVLLIVILLAGIGIFYTATHWRGWTASTSTKMMDKMLTEANIDPKEHLEIMAHVETLMQRFEDKDISIEQLGNVIEKLSESPVIPSAMVMGIDSFYFTESDLDEAEKAQGRIDLARFTQGLFDESIEPDTINDVLEPIITNTPDDNDIRLNLTIDSSGGRTINALRSPDEVTGDDLRELIALAKATADEQGISETPAQIDLSDEIAKAIGIALGEIAEDSTEEEDAESADVETTDDDSTTPATDDGP